MPASVNVNVTGITDSVRRAIGVMASAKVLIQGQTDSQKEAVRAALEADNKADDTTIQAAMDALDGVNTELNAGVDELASALTANPAAPPA